jgi:hypothetical protein
LTVTNRITGLSSVAEIPVVAVGVVNRVDNNIVHLVARVVRATNTVIDDRRRTSLAYAAQASLYSVAVQAIVAVAIRQALNAGVTRLIA